VSGDGRVVRIVGLPTEAFVRAQLHVDELLHELELLQAGADAGVASPPAGLRALMDEILADYAESRRTAWEQTELAREAGRDRFDLELTLPPEAAAATRRLVELLEQADDLCRARQLLTLAAPPEVADLRRWLAGEVASQLQRGAAPSPCPL
jgi:hypothetical protein